MKLFEYAVLLHPTDKEAEEGGSTSIVVPVTPVLASGENAAVMLAGRAIPESYLDKLDRIEVVVRPF